MRECRRVFSRRSLLWLLVLMAAVVFFHRVDHHNAPGFAAAYRQTAAQLAASPDPSAALSQMEAESRRYMTALLWRSTDDPDWPPWQPPSPTLRRRGGSPPSRRC